MGYITKDQVQDITNAEARKGLSGFFARILARITGKHGLLVAQLAN
jgi:hypothetical protein